MISTQQLVSGIINYADAEIIPKLSGVKRYGSAVYLALAAKNAQATIPAYLNSPAIKLLGVCDEHGNIDLDKIHAAAIQAFKDDKMTVEVPVIGAFTFTRDDVDRLCETIRRM